MQHYLADDENFPSFTCQMAKMGLKLRDIPGDGNCLFRALGDQLQGHGRNHQKLRSDVTKYMMEHRADFEPFVEDDIPFERHVANLKKLGTYAGNDAIVAFARLNNVNVVIHQLNSPMWTIKGLEKGNVRELHISYHNGDHYSSVRSATDNTELPAYISIKNGSPSTEAVMTFQKPDHYGGAASYTSTYHDITAPSACAYSSSVMYDDDSDYDNVQPEEYPRHKAGMVAAAAGVARAYRDKNDVIEQVMAQSGCMDRMLVQQTLEDNHYDVETSLLTIQVLTQGCGANSESSYNTSDGSIWSENGSATRIFGGPDTGASPAPTPPTQTSTTGRKDKSKITSRDRKSILKREKKLRALERHKNKLRGDQGGESEDEETMGVTYGMGVLQI